ncbi:MAG: hypothetical protein H6719_34235 [Sandaracinaceae bacterium]|nr:hypothetical protein [Sandaracinaceae bacterium]
MGTIERAITIAPGARHTFAWPSTFADTDVGGEVAFYQMGRFSMATDQIDFVCWGTGHSPSRKSLAESDGDWSGACTGAITGTQLRRIRNTDGHGPASYDPTGTAAPLTCP